MRPYHPFLLVAVLFFTAMFVLEHMNGRFWLSDFRVYWGAADALVHGQQVYGPPFGEPTGFYKYSPFTAMLFMPLALMPFEVASVIWFWCVAAATVTVIIALHHLLEREVFGPHVKRTGLVLSLSLLCVGNHMVRELHLGNVNVVLLLVAVLAFRSASARPYLAGALLAGLFMVKPYLGLLFIPFVVRGRWKILVAALLSGAGMLLLPLMLGFATAVDLHAEWLRSMAEHGEYLTSANTVSSWVHRAAGLEDGPFLQFCIIGAAVVVAIILAWRQRREPFTGAGAFLLFFGSLAAIPDLVITDTQHFLLALPLFMFLIHFLSRTRDVPILILFLLVCAVHGGNSSDLLGGELSDKVNAWGVLGMANLLLIGLCAAVAVRRKATRAAQ